MLEAASTFAARLVIAVLDGADVQKLAGGFQSRMSGICAVWRKQDAGRTQATVGSVCAGLRLDRSEKSKTAIAGSAGVGVSARFPGQQLIETPRLLLACETDLYNQGELFKLLGGAPDATADSATAATLAALYDRFGTGFLEKLRGDF